MSHLLLAVVVLAAEPGPAAKARQALDESARVRFENKTLPEVVAYFQARLGVEVRLDPAAVAAIDPTAPAFTVTSRDGSYRDALNAALAPFELRCGVVGGGVFVSTEDGLTRKQLRQRVSLVHTDTPLSKVVAAMAETTGANLVVDPRVKAKAAQAAVDLTLDDVPLETAVRLTAEVAGFRAVRLGNVIYVTTDDRAALLRADLADPKTAEPDPVADKKVERKEEKVRNRSSRLSNRPVRR